MPTGAVVPGNVLSPPQRTHAHTHIHAPSYSHVHFKQPYCKRVSTGTHTHSCTRRSTLHINKDKSRNGQCKAPGGTKLLLGDHSRVAVCLCVCAVMFVFMQGQSQSRTPFASITALTTTNGRLSLVVWGAKLSDFLSKSLPAAVKAFKDSKMIWQYNHSKSPNNVPKGSDNLTMTLSAAVSHIKDWIAPLSSSAACFGMGWAASVLIPDKNPSRWGDTVQSVFPLC